MAGCGGPSPEEEAKARVEAYTKKLDAQWDTNKEQNSSGIETRFKRIDSAVEYYGNNILVVKQGVSVSLEAEAIAFYCDNGVASRDGRNVYCQEPPIIAAPTTESDEYELAPSVPHDPTGRGGW